MDVMQLLEEQVDRLIAEHRGCHAELTELKRTQRQLEERLEQAIAQLKESRQETQRLRESLEKAPDPARVDEARRRIESLLSELEDSSDPDGGSCI